TLIAIDKGSRLPFGFLQAYNWNLKDGWCFFQVHFEREQRGNDSCAEAGVALLDYVFRNFDVRKIYMDVYDLNREVLGRALTQAFVEEGRFGEHTWHQGQYRDLVRVALYREEWPTVRGRVNFVLDVQAEASELLDAPPRENVE
ncbi:MAG: GNAT family N-acetyltransferase, partial [Chloroflexi bacterium]|nr:GNAT family N-acetyltransferase [Chloroflexota bacterium]